MTDFEDVIDGIKSIMVAHLNNKLDQISTEKGDSIPLPHIVDSGYYLQSNNDEIINADPFIAYGISDVENESQGPHSIEKLMIHIHVIISERGRSDINRVMFRYSRALKEIFEEHWQMLSPSCRIYVSRLNVVPFESLDGSEQYKAIGIELNITI